MLRNFRKNFSPSKLQQPTPKPPTTSEAAGFLCPICMKSFENDIILQEHFLNAHTDDDDGPAASPPSPAPPASPAPPGPPPTGRPARADGPSADSSNQIESLQSELKTVRAELDRLGRGNVDDELVMFREQLKASEESRTMLTELVTSLQVEQENLQQTVRSLSEEREEARSKLAESRQHIADLKSSLDESNSKASALENELVAMKTTLEETAIEKERLAVELTERPSADDVQVLRQELSNVQHIMDKANVEKEQTVELLRDRNAVLEANLSAARLRAEQLEVEAGGSAHRTNGLADQLDAVRRENQALLSQVGRCKQELSETLEQKSREIDQLNEKLVAEKNGHQKTVDQLNGEIKTLQERADSERNHFHQLKTEKEETVKTLEEQLFGLEKQLSSANSAMEALSKERDTAHQLSNSLQTDLDEERRRSETAKNESAERERQFLQQLGDSQSDCEVSAKEVQSLRDEVERLKAEAAQFESKLLDEAGLDRDNEGNTAVLDSLKQVLEDKTNHIADLEQKLQTTTTELRNTADSLRRSNEDNQRQTAAMNNLQQLVEKLQIDVDDKARLLDDGRRQLDGAVTDKGVLQVEVDRLQEQRVRLQGLLDGAQARNSELERDILSFKDRVAELTGSVQSLKSELTQKVSDLELLEKSRSEEVTAVTSELDRTQKLLLESQCEVDTLHQNCSKLTKEIQQHETQQETLLTSASASETTIQQLRGAVASLTTQLEERATQLAKVQLDLDKAISDHKKAIDVNGEVQRENERLSADVFVVNEQLKTIENARSSLEKQLKRSEETVETLKTQLDSANLQVATEQSNNCTLQSALDKLSAECKEKSSELSSSQNQVESLTAQLVNARQESANLEKELKRLRGELNAKVEQLNKELNQCHSELTTLNETLLGKDRALEDGQLALRASENEVSKLAALTEQLNSERERLANEITEKSSQLDELNSNLQRCQTERDSLQDRLGATEKELQFATTDVSQIRQEKAVLDERLVVLETDLSKERDLEIFLRDKTELQQRAETAENRLSDIQTEMVGRASRIDQLTNEASVHLAEISRLETEINSLRAEVEGGQSRVSQCQQEADNLRQTCDQLKAENESVRSENRDLRDSSERAQRERDLLLKRCETNEADRSDQLAEVARLQHELSETKIALAELGRENQNLQIHSNSIEQRKWEDDAKVKQCSNCQREFNLTIRKHHCRHCGQIFCNNCSSKTARLASSKNPVRVCDQCHEQANGGVLSSSGGLPDDLSVSSFR